WRGGSGSLGRRGKRLGELGVLLRLHCIRLLSRLLRPLLVHFRGAAPQNSVDHLLAEILDDQVGYHRQGGEHQKDEDSRRDDEAAAKGGRGDLTTLIGHGHSILVGHHNRAAARASKRALTRTPFVTRR